MMSVGHSARRGGTGRLDENKLWGRPWTKSCELFASVYQCWFVFLSWDLDSYRLISLQNKAIQLYTCGPKVTREKAPCLPILYPLVFPRVGISIKINGVSCYVIVMVCLAEAPCFH